LAEDERRAEFWRQKRYQEEDQREKDKISKRKQATKEQIKALELEKAIQANRRKQLWEDDMKVNGQQCEKVYFPTDGWHVMMML